MLMKIKTKTFVHVPLPSLFLGDWVIWGYVLCLCNGVFFSFSVFGNLARELAVSRCGSFYLIVICSRRLKGE